MTLPRARGEVPAEELLGRRAFALAPWIAVSLTAFGLMLSDLIRTWGGPIDRFVVGTSLAMGVVTAVLAACQDLPIGRRYRRSLWVYVLGSAVVLVFLASLAVHDDGVASVFYVAACPLAAYFGFVFPYDLRYFTLGGLVGATVLVQVLNAHTALFDAAIITTLVYAAWGCGTLVSVGHARIAKISRRLSSYDRLTGSLNRRGFMEQFERAVAPGDSRDESIALLLVDLIGFSAVNADGHEAGDELLGWIGGRLPSLLPDRAELGRLGDDEFGVLLPGVTRDGAEEVARAIRMELHGRISAAIGVATSQTRDIDAPDLFRVADAALAVARTAPLGVHALVAGTVARGRTAARPSGVMPGPPALTYAQIRATGRVPRVVERGEMDNRVVTLSLLLVAAAGVPVIVRGMLGHDTNVYDEIVRYGGVFWVMGFLLIAAVVRGRAIPERSRLGLFVVTSSSILMAIGVGVAALAGGGLTAPIIAAVFLKVLFDAAVSPYDRAWISLGIMGTGWVVVAVLGPTSALWVVPLHLALLGGSYALGTIGQRAMRQTASHAKHRPLVDDLTQLPNRVGFRRWAEEAFYVSATTTGTPFGVLSFRLNGLHRFNATHGHAAGDQLLIDIAALLVQRLPEAHVIGRTGATEFTAAVAMSKARDAIWLTDEIRAAILDVLGVTVGYGTCPEDGATLEALWRVAEERVFNGRQGGHGPQFPSALAAGRATAAH
ncbi:MAG: GGDEF domain-containing protein [Solirubrobacteraceae bacterium]